MDNIKEFDTASGNNKNYKIIIGILIVVLVAFGYLFYDQKVKTKEKIAELNEVNKEKETLTFQYQNLLDDFESIETENDSITKQLSYEQERIKEIMLELRNTKSENRAQITKYKNELKTLRDIMKGFVRQIDSLNTLNIQLAEENQQFKKQISSARKENKQLTEKYEQAADKVELASVIRAINLKMESYNHKGKASDKAKKVKRFAVSFALDENVIAAQGTKKVYIRITDPNEHVLMTNNQETFAYQKEQIAYSAYREVNYEGKVVNLTVYYEIEQEDAIETGKYKADIFCDGHMIGTTNTEIR